LKGAFHIASPYGARNEIPVDSRRINSRSPAYKWHGAASQTPVATIPSLITGFYPPILQNVPETETISHRCSSGREGAGKVDTKQACFDQQKAEALMSENSQIARHPALRYLPFIVILVVAMVGFFTLRDYLSFQTLADNHEALLAYRDAHYLIAAIGFVMIYIMIAGFSLPGATFATLTGGFLFGVFPGALFNITGAATGATLLFLAARWGLGEKLAARMESSDGTVKAIKEGIDENQWSMLFIIRLVPVVPFFVANLVPALVGVPLRRFVISTFLGIIPGGVVYTSVGAGLGDVFARGETPNLGIIFEPQIILPILGLVALAILPMILKFIKKGSLV